MYSYHWVCPMQPTANNNHHIIAANAGHGSLALHKMPFFLIDSLDRWGWGTIPQSNGVYFSYYAMRGSRPLKCFNGKKVNSWPSSPCHQSYFRAIDPLSQYENIHAWSKPQCSPSIRCFRLGQLIFCAVLGSHVQHWRLWLWWWFPLHWIFTESAVGMWQV